MLLCFIYFSNIHYFIYIYFYYLLYFILYLTENDDLYNNIQAYIYSARFSFTRITFTNQISLIIYTIVYIYIQNYSSNDIQN